MSIVTVTPGPLAGTVQPPASKSDAHRAILCAALAPGTSTVRRVTWSEDIAATLSVIRAMGAAVEQQGDTLQITGGRYAHAAALDCGESGSTLRFALPVAAALGIRATFTGRGRLPDRPIDTMLELLAAHGVAVEGNRLPVTLSGRLTPGRFALPGNISSQYVTGLLLALPLLAGDSEIVLTTPLQSAGYVEMTLAAMAAFGVTVTATDTGYQIAAGGYRPADYTVEGDWSGAAFPMAAGLLHDRVILRGLSRDTAQGDAAVQRVFADFGGDICWQGRDLMAAAAPLQGITVDVSQIPDMVPAIAAVAALAPGETRILGAGRLRMKESDRLAAIARNLTALGIPVEEGEDSLVIHGGQPTGGYLEGYHDHRIVMAFAILASRADRPVTITDADAVAKSYPAFWADFAALGGQAHVI